MGLDAATLIMGRDPVELAKRAKYKPPAIAGARRWLYQKITFPL